MSSVTNPQPDPTADEIVAYLDGELPPQDCRRVENRLATDEDYRQQLHDLDRAWEALDALPTPTVDDAFARTTIELACVAAEADLTEHTSLAKAAKRSRKQRWMAAGVVAVVVGFLAGRGLIPNRNAALLADLPAIQQYNALQYVEDVEFLRRLGESLPPEQLVKDEPAFKRNLEELGNANSSSLDTRREWLQSLQPEQKAELADRNRAFNGLEPSPEEQQRMRTIMAEISKADDRATLEKTLVAYGQWLSRHSAGQQEEIREELEGKTADKQAEIVHKLVESEGKLAARHLTDDDAEKLRQEIMRLVKENGPEFAERARPGRKNFRMNLDGPFAEQHATMRILVDLLKGPKRDATIKQLVGALSPAQHAHWQNLEHSPREFAKLGQLWVWIYDAMKLKADPQTLQKFFATEGKLNADERQKLLDEPRARMETDLERLYYRSELGIDYPGQLFGYFGEPGRWNGRGIGPPPGEGGMRNRPPFFGPRREPRPDGGPNEGPPDHRRRPPPTSPPAPDKKQEAV
jgi:hypothetical protein